MENAMLEGDVAREHYNVDVLVGSKTVAVVNVAAYSKAQAERLAKAKLKYNVKKAYETLDTKQTAEIPL